MMLSLLPWKFLVRRAARRYGVLDPATWLARMRRFAQPSEVQEPIELLRAGIIFHARGLVNSKAIQHNLDWVWPFWVERQFNPEDPSFVPRAFSFSHVNLTHRNWTAVGVPDLAAFPIVDPRGLVTPLHDGWSLDFWVVAGNRRLLPSKLDDGSVAQRLRLKPTLQVETECAEAGLNLKSATCVEPAPNGSAEVKIRIEAFADEDAWLVVAVRPYNPEGVQFIDHIAMSPGRETFVVNDSTKVELDCPADALRMAHYADGDVYFDLHGSSGQTEIKCDVGLATAAALFRLEAGRKRLLKVSVPLECKTPEPRRSWAETVAESARLEIPDARMQFLYDAAVRTLVLLSTDELVPGPYTYRRFWFRDACLMLHPLLAIGFEKRALEIIESFPSRQTRSGYFLSQEGEWDSNGQVLWIAARLAAVTGRTLSPELEKSLHRAVGWLEAKRRSGKRSAPGTQGLLPAGFSAEHLGPNDYYYWDDFWAVAGLRGISEYWLARDKRDAAENAESLASAFLRSIEESLAGIPESRSKGAMPAAPSRRLDAGAIGSMVADYPLQLYPPGEARLMKTADHLMENSFHKGGFFQEMIHSGINAYLTLDLAQTYLRAGDGRFAELMTAVAALASPTGQWPEAIHPNTLGGCMGDGQHGWAAGEWVMMIRNCFVREESEGDRLVIGSGILPEWMESGSPLAYGPTLTRWGIANVQIASGHAKVDLTKKKGDFQIEIAVPGHLPVRDVEPGKSYRLEAL